MNFLVKFYADSPPMLSMTAQTIVLFTDEELGCMVDIVGTSPYRTGKKMIIDAPLAGLLASFRSGEAINVRHYLVEHSMKTDR